MNTKVSVFAFSLFLSVIASVQAADETYSGTLYRNEGHYGDVNSDVRLENARTRLPALVVAGAPSAPEHDGVQTWNGTLYRNGGYYGSDNSDQILENAR